MFLKNLFEKLKKHAESKNSLKTGLLLMGFSLLAVILLFAVSNRFLPAKEGEENAGTDSLVLSSNFDDRPEPSANHSQASLISSPENDFLPGTGIGEFSDNSLSDADTSKKDGFDVKGDDEDSLPVLSEGKDDDRAVSRDTYIYTREDLKKTGAFFSANTEKLAKSLEGGSYASKVILLDENIKTYAYVYAKNDVFAENLNGFFYYLIDESVSTESLSPVVLTIDKLFEESKREEVRADGSFAEKEIAGKLKASLKVFLGDLYREEVYDFIIENYREIFRLVEEGNSPPICLYELQVPGLRVYFRNAFMTYVEFILTG